VPSVHFITIKAERLAAVIAVILVVLSLASYLVLTRKQNSTPIPKAVAWYALPSAAGPFSPLLLQSIPETAWPATSSTPASQTDPQATSQSTPDSLPTTLPVLQIGAPAPDFTLPTLDNQSLSLSSCRGYPVLLYFWASWCTFCREDMQALAERYRPEQVASTLRILAVNLWERPEQVRAFQRQLDFPFPILLDTKGQVSQIYQVRATPTSFFIDKDGILRAQLVGRAGPEVFAANLAAIME